MSAPLPQPAPAPESPTPIGSAWPDPGRVAWEKALSALTSGLAHDFGNVIARIHAVSESFLAQAGPEHEFREGLEHIQTASHEASRLVRRIISLHQDRAGETQYHDLNELVATASELARILLPRPMEFALEAGLASLPVFVDAVAFRQAVIHLVRHLLEGMPPDGRLVLRVSSPAPPLPAAPPEEAELPPPVACLTLSDQSFRSPAGLWPEVFNPPPATKRERPGSGPDCHCARLFAEKHRGGLAIEAGEGQGTTIHLWLPQADFTERTP